MTISRTTDTPTPLLGGLSPQAFMRRHWQKKPLLIRQAQPGAHPTIDRAQLFALAATEGVESRLIEQRAGRWSLRHGPFTRRQLPPLARPAWTLLVQGVDLHLPAAHQLMSGFRFASDARLDDVMVSYASDGGGVGPHVDSYDVFLLQLAGRRRWRVARPQPVELVPGMPLKILANFEPEQEWTLEAGDMLYLPPGWAHDGVAEGECLTASIGFRAPTRSEVGLQVLQRMVDGADDEDESPRARYRDAAQAATAEPARIPPRLAEFAAEAVRRLVDDPASLQCALGEWLSEPKPQTWFDPADVLPAQGAVALDARTRMLYDDRHVFINGESFVAAGRDARLMRQLADCRILDARAVASLSADAQELLQSWVFQGWLRTAEDAGRGSR